MKKPSSSSITSLPASPDDERKRRMIEYTVMMSTRVLCILVCLLLAVLGVAFWIVLIPGLAAIFLPYFAVVTANALPRVKASRVERPGAIERHRGQQ